MELFKRRSSQSIIINSGVNNDNRTGHYGEGNSLGSNNASAPCIDLMKYNEAAVYYEFTYDGSTSYVAQFSGENTQKLEHDVRLNYPSSSGSLQCLFVVNELTITNKSASPQTMQTITQTITEQRSVAIHSWTTPNIATYYEDFDPNETRVLTSESPVLIIQDHTNHFGHVHTWSSIPNNPYLGFDLNTNNSNLAFTGMKVVLKVRGVYK